MLSFKKYVTSIALLFYATICFSQDDIRVDHFTVEDGLSYRWVFDIVQDHNGFIWIGTYDGLNRFDGTNFKIYKHSDTDTNTISNNRIKSLAADESGFIWIVGEDRVLNRLNISNDSISLFHLYEGLDQISIERIEVLNMIETDLGDFWVIMHNSDENGSLDFFRSVDNITFESFGNFNLPFDQIIGATSDGGNKFWIWTWTSGYYLIDPVLRSIEHFTIPNKGSQYPDLPLDNRGMFWLPGNTGELTSFSLSSEFNKKNLVRLGVDKAGNISFYNGGTKIFNYNRLKEKIEIYDSPIFQAVFDKGVEDHNLSNKFLDNEGSIWLGHFYGALKFRNTESLFSKYLEVESANPSLPVTGVSSRAMTQSSSGDIYMVDQSHNLYRLDFHSNAAYKTSYKSRTKEDYIAPNNNFVSLFEDSLGQLWQSTSAGLMKLDPHLQQYERIELPTDIGDGDIVAFQTLAKEIWIGTDRGLMLYDQNNNTYSHPKGLFPNDSMGVTFEYAIYDSNEDVIYGQYDRGITVTDCKFKSTKYHQLYKNKIESETILSFLKWKNKFWLGTNNGLIQYDPETNEKTVFTEKNGLPSNIIYSVLASDNDLWLGTHNGLCQFNPFTNQTTTYYKEQGLPHNEFNRWSALKTKEGNLYFGGLNGVISLNPNDFEIPDSTLGSLHLVGMTKLNVKQDTLLKIPIFPTNAPSEITIGSNERTVSFQYALTLFDDVKKNHYYHYMEGLETDWIEDGSQNEVRYFQIPPGQYTFRVKATGPRKISAKNELAISIIVLQVWYMRWWAILCYILLVLSAIARVYRFQLNRRLEKQDANRIRELDQVKTKLYTNITHEFRTPLTVIIGMAQQISEYISRKSWEKLNYSASLIEKNGKNLLHLVNQLLDLSKLESGKVTLEIVHGNVVAYIKYLTESIRTLAESKDVSLEFSSNVEEVFMDYSPESIRQVLSNLLSNAIKFTPTGGKVSVQVSTEESNIMLKVKDNGAGIAEEKIPYIFDRFYQVHGTHTRKEVGTGIGLSLVKELTKLMGGKITVESSLGSGTCFILSLPIKQSDSTVPEVTLQDNNPLSLSMVASSKVSEPLTPQTSLSLGDDRPILLVVEDNKDVAQYIRDCLEEDYQIQHALNGRIGLEMAFEIIPDVIISDVMMPEMNGFEMVYIIKNDERTSHIPSILLTAKADIASRIQGFETGADAYLAKPFDKKELQVRMHHLLLQRRQLLARYSKGFIDTSVTQESDSRTEKEDAFLAKVQEVVISHLSDSQFDTSMLCHEIGMSKTQLYRKLKALTDRSIAIYIRSIRLQKGKELVVNSELSISEIAYDVGFSDPAYFSRSFSEEFGQSPINFRN